MKATHYGTCQVCGSIQKLPNGKLAKHGYTVDWGFFEGVCPGSHNLPFEQSTDLIQASIDSANRTLISVNNLITDAEFAANSGITVAWIQLYKKPAFSASRRGVEKGGYYWQQLPIIRDERTNDYGTLVTFHVIEPDGKKRNVGTYDHNTIADVVAYQNARYVASVLVPRTIQLREYIKWQGERVASWQPKELRPVK